MCAFPTNKGIHLCNHNTTIKTRKLALLRYYVSPIFLRWLCSTMIQPGIMCCHVSFVAINLSMWNGSSVIFLFDFHNFATFEDYRPICFLNFLNLLCWCFHTIRFRPCIFGRNTEETILCPLCCIPSGAANFWCVPVLIGVTQIICLRWHLPGFSSLRLSSFSLVISKYLVGRQFQII